MGDVGVIGLDLAKGVFQVRAADVPGRAMLRRHRRCSRVVNFYSRVLRHRSRPVRDLVVRGKLFDLAIELAGFLLAIDGRRNVSTERGNSAGGQATGQVFDKPDQSRGIHRGP